MTEREEKRVTREKAHQAQQEFWMEQSKAHWNHWRAWGSWFSWGSPVGLGLFFVLGALAAAILIVAIKL